MLKKTLVAAVAAVALAVPATTAFAQPPEETVVDDLFLIYPDFENGKSVFINITARDFCDWVPEGPEPPSGPPPVLEPVATRGVTTGKGAIVVGFEAKDLYIEMWDISGVAEPIGPCWTSRSNSTTRMPNRGPRARRTLPGSRTTTSSAPRRAATPSVTAPGRW